MAECNNVYHINFLDESKITGLTTAKGDLVTHDGSTLTILGAGTNGYVLKANSAAANGIEWAASTAIVIPSTPGDVVYVDGSGNLVVDNTGSVNNFAYTATNRALEYGLWVNSILVPGQGVKLGTISAQVAPGDSIALGNGSTTNDPTAIVLGKDADATGSTSAIIIGNGATLDSTAGATNVIAIGTTAQIDGSVNDASGAIALGDNAISSNLNAISIGKDAAASGANSTAIGTGAIAPIDNTIGIAGPFITRNDEAVTTGTERLQKFSSAVVTLATEIINLAAATSTTTITIPTGATFYPSSVEIIQVTAGTGAGNCSNILLGQTGTTNKYLTVGNYKANNATKKQTSYTGFDSTIGTTTPTVTTGAATTNAGTVRVVWKGVLLED